MSASSKNILAEENIKRQIKARRDPHVKNMVTGTLLMRFHRKKSGTSRNEKKKITPGRPYLTKMLIVVESGGICPRFSQNLISCV